METRYPVGGAFVEAVQRDLTHAGHDAHVGDHVWAVGNLDADLGVRRGDRAHDVRDDVHGSALHRVLEEWPDLLFCLGGGHPVVGGPGVLLVFGADEGEVFCPRHILGIRAVDVAVGQRVLVQSAEGAVSKHLANEALVFGVAAIAPHHLIGMGGAGDFINPLFHGRRHWHPSFVRGEVSTLPPAVAVPWQDSGSLTAVARWSLAWRYT